MKPPEDDLLLPLLERYLAGEASGAEAAAVREWLLADPAHPALLEDLRLVRRLAAEQAPESDVDAAWGRAVAALGLGGEPAAAPDSASARTRSFPARRPAALPRFALPARHRVLRPALAAAAAAAVVFGVLGAMRWLRPPAAGAPEWREFATRAAQRAIIRLSDGTQIVLAPASRLRYPADYGAARRDVQLAGEAYFEVVHDAARPFRVHVRGGVAEDLGTAFVVKSYPDAAATEVVVTEGRVALWRADTATSPSRPAPLLLSAGDLGRLAAAGPPTVRRQVDVERYLAWTKGVLVFDGTPLGEVVPALERWYDLEIQLVDRALAARPLTATFRAEPVAQVLERIALTLDLRVVRQGRSVVLSPSSSSESRAP